MSLESIVALKKSGTVALNSGDHSDALKYYSEALNLLSQNFNVHDTDGLRITSSSGNSRLEASLYSKRSVALLRLSQYYYAFEDAKQMVAILPEWFKGYLRKADIELDCGLFEDALKDYQLALRYLDGEGTSSSKRSNYDKFINQKIKHVLFMMQRERCFDYQIPWIGAALGLVLGMAIITWDYVSHGTRSYINHPILKLACIGGVAYVFFYLATLQRSLNRKHKLELLKPPYGA